MWLCVFFPCFAFLFYFIFFTSLLKQTCKIPDFLIEALCKYKSWKYFFVLETFHYYCCFYHEGLFGETKFLLVIFWKTSVLHGPFWVTSSWVRAPCLGERGFHRWHSGAAFCQKSSQELFNHSQHFISGSYWIFIKLEDQILYVLRWSVTNWVKLIKLK